MADALTSSAGRGLDHDAVADPAGAAVSSHSRTVLTRLSDVLSYAILVAGVLTITQAVRLCIVCYSRIPYWDMWAMIHYLVNPNRPQLQWLWAQHNEHRIVTAKLLFLLDFRLFHASEAFLLGTGFVLLAAHLVLLSWAAHVLAGLRGPAWRTATGLSAFCLFCTSQWENFTTGFQVCFFLQLFFVSAAVLAIVLHGRAPARPSSQWYLLLAIVAAIAASFTFGNGLLIWPLLLLIAVAGGYGWRTFIAVAVAAFLTGTADLYHYHRMAGRSDPLRSLHAPLRVLDYVLKYLGAPWVESDLRWAVVFGLIGVAAAAFAMWKIIGARRRHPANLFFLALIVFYLGTPILTALARQVVGTEQGALSARYEAFALMFWLCVGVLLVIVAHRRQPALLIIAQALVLATMVLAASRTKFPLRSALWRAMVNNTAANAMLAGVFDPDAFSHVAYGPRDRLWADVLLLRAQEKSTFASARARQLHHPLPDAYEIRPEPCRGALVSTPAGIPGAAGLRLTGWAWDPVRQRPVTDLIITEQDKIVGYAQGGFARRDALPANMRFTAFTGYAPPANPGSLLAYGVVRSRVLCRVE